MVSAAVAWSYVGRTSMGGDIGGTEDLPPKIIIGGGDGDAFPPILRRYHCKLPQ